MIRYYFDIVEDDQVSVDDEGLLLVDVNAAKREASLSLAEIARDKLRSARTISRLSIVVRTSDGLISEAHFKWDPKSLQ
jgi:hypothetical protein